jgi:formamidopyrimidine-DNA glycosylase
MPELPEVETVARQLAPHLVGRRVRALRILDPLLRRGRTPGLRGRRIAEVGRAGKQVRIGFEAADGDGELWLAVHLRMTGRLQWAEEGTRATSRYLRARFRLDRGHLLFYDTRRFGTFSWSVDRDGAWTGGVDPLDPSLDDRRFGELLAGSSQALKVWLLRQDRLVGLGNIYASEICHVARLSPMRAVNTLDPRERRRLLRATRSVLDRAIRNCGTTFSDFQDAYGVTGSYQQFLRVYGREGLRCRRCGGTIARFVQQQRSTFFCPVCQR